MNTRSGPTSCERGASRDSGHSRWPFFGFFECSGRGEPQQKKNAKEKTKGRRENVCGVVVGKKITPSSSSAFYLYAHVYEKHCYEKQR